LIADAVTKICGSGLLQSDNRACRAKLAKNNLAAEAGAKYLWDVLRYKVNDKQRSYGFLNNENS